MTLTRKQTVAGIVALAALGVVLAVDEWLRIIHNGALGADFRHPLWLAGKEILRGDSPYFPPTSPLLANADPSAYPALYPPPLMLAVTPLSLIPLWVAFGIWLAVQTAAMLLSLWIVGVRDWRCYLLWGASAAPAGTLPQGNATPLLLLCVALMWRFRDRRWLAGGAVAAATAIKLWPAVLALWLVRTGRRDAAVLSLILAAVVIVGCWLVMGFHGLVDYPAMLRAHARANAIEGEFVVGIALNVGLPLVAAAALGLGVAAVLVALAWRVVDERVSLALVIAAALFASTLGWPQYLMLLIVPIAAFSPTFSGLWLFALLPYVSMQLGHQPDGGRLSRALWTTSTTLAVLAIYGAAARRRRIQAAPAT